MASVKAILLASALVTLLSTMLSDPAQAPRSSHDTDLPAQEAHGLRAEGRLRAIVAGRRTLVLDLCLANTESGTKTWLTVETVTLGGRGGVMTRPAAQTLWRRGSFVRYPALASWQEPSDRPPAPLDVAVRFQVGPRVVRASFRWQVGLGGGVVAPEVIDVSRH